MTRSLKKGPFLDERLMRKLVNVKPGGATIKTWARACDISPEMVGFTFGVHNGRTFIDVFVTEDMVGHKLGEFSPTRKFTRHGGKMQKELDMKKKEAEIAAAKAGAASADAKAPAKK
jgi:small subunit ribosomal protein S19